MAMNTMQKEKSTQLYKRLYNNKISNVTILIFKVLCQYCINQNMHDC